MRELPGWWAIVQALPTPVRRDLLRGGVCTTVRWEDVDLDAATMKRPNPKGGRAKEFGAPSPHVVDLLKRRRDENKLLFGNDEGLGVPHDARTRRRRRRADRQHHRAAWAKDGSRYDLCPR